VLFDIRRLVLNYLPLMLRMLEAIEDPGVDVVNACSLHSKITPKHLFFGGKVLCHRPMHHLQHIGNPMSVPQRAMSSKTKKRGKESSLIRT